MPHRYRLGVTNSDLLTLWLEDRQTTRQWQTAELKLEDFVSSGNFIAQTHMAGYARPIGEQTQAEFWTRRQYEELGGRIVHKVLQCIVATLTRCHRSVDVCSTSPQAFGEIAHRSQLERIRHVLHTHCAHEQRHKPTDP